MAIVMRPERIAVVRLPSSGLDLREAVSNLRDGLDPSGIARGAPLPPVSVDLAYRSYLALIKPLEKELAGATALIVVSDPAVAGLPFPVLVSEKPQEPTWDADAPWRPHWLVDRFAVAMAPSAEAVSFWRSQHRPQTRPDSVLVLGDPVLDGGAKEASGKELFVGGRPQPDVLRARFASLPGAGAETREVADTVSRTGRSSLTGEHFTKPGFRHAPLSDFRVVLFATHAMPAEGKDPAFILATPPAVASDEDDGVITASDIAGLRIASDVIFLSACNTGTGIGDEDGYGELVGAFFLAGAADVIATYWPVVSDAVENLTVPVSAYVAHAGPAGLPGTLQKSMQQMSQRPPGDRFRHPIFWAPFFIVGAPSS
jgi:CHAT domain-containing protein